MEKPTPNGHLLVTQINFLLATCLREILFVWKQVVEYVKVVVWWWMFEPILVKDQLKKSNAPGLALGPQLNEVSLQEILNN